MRKTKIKLATALALSSIAVLSLQTPLLQVEANTESIRTPNIAPFQPIPVPLNRQDQITDSYLGHLIFSHSDNMQEAIDRRVFCFVSPFSGPNTVIGVANWLNDIPFDSSRVSFRITSIVDSSTTEEAEGRWAVSGQVFVDGVQARFLEPVARTPVDLQFRVFLGFFDSSIIREGAKANIHLLLDDHTVFPERVTPDDAMPEEDILGGVSTASFGLLRRPESLAFSYGEISAFSTDDWLRLPAITRTHEDGTEKLYEAVSIWDGRLEQDDWELSASIAPFLHTQSGNTLNGATVEFVKTQAQSQAPETVEGDFSAVESFRLTTDNTPTRLISASPSAKAQTDFFWDNADVELIAHGSQAEVGSYRSTISWVLSSTPNS